MKKDCTNCFASKIEDSYMWCNKYDCECNEVAKEKENPSCWEEVPPDYYDMHVCEYKNGYCIFCGKIQYKSNLYCEIYGCDP